MTTNNMQNNINMYFEKLNKYINICNNYINLMNNNKTNNYLYYTYFSKYEEYNSYISALHNAFILDFEKYINQKKFIYNNIDYTEPYINIVNSIVNLRFYKNNNHESKTRYLKYINNI